MQAPRADDLWPQHLFETVPGLITERRVGQYAHAMDDTAKRRQLRGHPTEHLIYRRRVRYIGDFHAYRGAATAQGFDRFPGFRVGWPPPVEHDGAGAVLGEPARDRAADTAKPARDEIGSILAQLSVRQR